MSTNSLLANWPLYLYNLVLLGGTAYFVQFHDWNPWWFLLTVSVMLHPKETK